MAVGPVCDSSVVTTWEQIQQNILRLEAYRHSQETQEIDFYKGLIKRGKCFVVSKLREQLLFGPAALSAMPTILSLPIKGTIRRMKSHEPGD